MDRCHDDEAVARIEGPEEEEPVVAEQPADVVGPGDRIREEPAVEDRPGYLGERVQVLIGNHRFFVVEVLGLGSDDPVHPRAEPGRRQADDGFELTVEDGHDRLCVGAGAPVGRMPDRAEPRAGAFDEWLVRRIIQTDRRPKAAVVDQGRGVLLEPLTLEIAEALVEASRAAREEGGGGHRELACKPGLHRVVARHHAGQPDAPAGVRPAVRGLPAHDDEVQALKGPRVEAVSLDQVVGDQLRIGDVGAERAHAADHRIDRHRGVDDARHDEGVGERARQPIPVVEQLVGGAHRPERDARLVEVLKQAGRAQREVEGVQAVHEHDVVGFAPGDRLAPCAHEQRPLLVVQVQLVDAVAAPVDVARVLVLVVEGEALLVDVVALRLPRLQVLSVEVPRTVQVVVQPVVEAPPGESELEVVGVDQRQPRHLVHPGHVVGELGVELGLVEVPVLGQVTGGVAALGGALPVLHAARRAGAPGEIAVSRPVSFRRVGQDPELRVGPEAEVEVPTLVEEVGVGGGSGPGENRQAEHQPTCRAPHGAAYLRFQGRCQGD